jgi:adenine-specific DNA-methyltransferase
MSKNYDKLIGLLKELFQFDRADLDFGIFRIMNQKRDEISAFLEKDLLPQVKEAFSEYKSADIAGFEDELKKTIKYAKEAGYDSEQSPKVKGLREKISLYGVDVNALENEVFSHLYNFFRRYYHEGDFLSLRRYKEGEKDNVKAQNGKERRFILFEEKPVEEIDGELVIRFEYRPDVEKRTQANLNKQAVETILNQKGVEQWVKELSELMPTEKNNDRTLLEKHLTDYTARNTFDYFIHKDLGGFLRRELDFYIKNEVMHLDDIENETAPRVEQYLSKIKVIRKIAGKIIAFLEQLENFQKKLWLKKKFVVETNYCVTLDRVPEALYEEIAANDTQREEWIKLFAIDEIEGEIGAEGYSKPLSMRFLKENKFLVVDTKFFEEDFKRKLLGSFEDLDAECDGLLVHSENFQALNLLQERYREKVKCIYIDPPYNTNASEIIYKNGYKNSSWLSFIENRLVLGKILLSKSGIQCTTIDDIEFHKLREIISGIFNEENIAGVVSIKNNPSGRSTVKGISIAHEYAIFSFSSGDSTLGMVPRTQEQLAQYREKDKKGKFQWRNFMRSGGANDFKTARPKLHYPLVVYKGLVRLPKMQWNTKTNIWEMIEKLDATETAVWPVSNGNEYTWRLGVDSLKPRIGEVRVRNSRNGKQIIEIKFRLDEEGVLPKTIWDDKYVNATAYGTTALRHITGIPQSFSFPKSIYAIERCIRVCGTTFDSIVIDYFAGSGTTAHALINLNREDNGNRKYILVEMGDYFDTVLKPRIQKVIYSKDWKNGKPISREGSSHMFKYICLESYEDTLNNLELKRTDKQEQLLLSLLNINTFNDPFNYKLNIATNSVGETKPTKIDMVETFNYLIGLTVKHIDHIQGFCVVEGTNPKEEKVLIIWRNIKEKSNKALETFFRKQDYSTRDMEFDLIYVNGDNNLENIRRPDETWKVRLIEEEFKRLMFDVEDV